MHPELRSEQMAERFLRHLDGDRFEVHSAGLEAMKEVGIGLPLKKTNLCQTPFQFLAPRLVGV